MDLFVFYLIFLTERQQSTYLKTYIVRQMLK